MEEFSGHPENSSLSISIRNGKIKRLVDVDDHVFFEGLINKGGGLYYVSTGS